MLFVSLPYVVHMMTAVYFSITTCLPYILICFLAERYLSQTAIRSCITDHVFCVSTL